MVTFDNIQWASYTTCAHAQQICTALLQLCTV